MSVHLGPGSQMPPRTEGKIRLYNMKFCPFSHKVRLALAFKNIPHEIININVKNKPEWYLQITPEGKVPALIDLDGKLVLDSNVILNYLDEKYPEPPLYNKNTIVRDSELIRQFDEIVKIFSNCIHKKNETPLPEAVEGISRYLVEFEEELKKRETPFFSGQKPGMLDIVMWPFVERAKAIPIIYKKPLNFEKDKFPCIMKWIDELKKLDFIKENYVSPEKFAKIVGAMDGETVDYDSL